MSPYDVIVAVHRLCPITACVCLIHQECECARRNDLFLPPASVTNSTEYMPSCGRKEPNVTAAPLIPSPYIQYRVDSVVERTIAGNRNQSRFNNPLV